MLCLWLRSSLQQDSFFPTANSQLPSIVNASFYFSAILVPQRSCQVNYFISFGCQPILSSASPGGRFILLVTKISILFYPSSSQSWDRNGDSKYFKVFNCYRKCIAQKKQNILNSLKIDCIRALEGELVVPTASNIGVNP